MSCANFNQRDPFCQIESRAQAPQNVRRSTSKARKLAPCKSNAAAPGARAQSSTSEAPPSDAPYIRCSIHFRCSTSEAPSEALSLTLIPLPLSLLPSLNLFSILSHLPLSPPSPPLLSPPLPLPIHSRHGRRWEDRQAPPRPGQLSGVLPRRPAPRHAQAAAADPGRTQEVREQATACLVATFATIKSLKGTRPALAPRSSSCSIGASIAKVNEDLDDRGRQTAHPRLASEKRVSRRSGGPRTASTWCLCSSCSAAACPRAQAS